MLFFSGYEISLDGVGVTVDGQPASFAPADALVPKGSYGIKVLVEREPTAGQAVAIKGDFCKQGGLPIEAHRVHGERAR